IDAMVGSNAGEGEEENESARALRDMMCSGAGRSILESQILQDKALERLLAIVRVEELPDIPAPQAVTDESEQDAEAEQTESEATGLAADEMDAQAAAPVPNAPATEDEAASTDADA